MKKSELIEAIAKEIEISRKTSQKDPEAIRILHQDTPRVAAEKALDGIFEVITNALVGDDYVKLIGFGTLKTVMRKENTGRNPRTGEVIPIPAKRIVKFVPGSELKEAVNTGEE